MDAKPLRCADSKARSARYLAVHKVDAWRLRKGCLSWLLSRPELKIATIEDHIDIYRWP